jgi:hypothetical protein
MSLSMQESAIRLLDFALNKSMKKHPVSAHQRVLKRREKLALQGLKEASSVIVPIHREAELRELAKSWVLSHVNESTDSTRSE